MCKRHLFIEKKCAEGNFFERRKSMEDVYISVTFVYDLSHLKLTERVMSGRKNVFKKFRFDLNLLKHLCFSVLLALG